MIKHKQLFLLFLLLPSTSLAHEGPPFPIVTDQRVGPYIVSVWTDPDIGIGTFFVVLEPADGSTTRAPERIQIAVVPVSGRLAESTYTAEAQRVSYGARYYAEVPFDIQDRWTVKVLIDGEIIESLTTEVESTPDGTIGPIGLVLYLLPFLGVGFLWLKAFLRRRRQNTTA